MADDKQGYGPRTQDVISSTDAEILADMFGEGAGGAGVHQLNTNYMQEQMARRAANRLYNTNKPKFVISTTEKVIGWYAGTFLREVSFAYQAALVKVGAKIIKSIKLSMKQGSYRPYLSKRHTVYKGKMWARRLTDIKEAYGLPTKAAAAVWVKLARREAYTMNPEGSVYLRGWKRKGKMAEATAAVIGRTQYAGRGTIHWSSAPGKAPAPDTERLMNSLKATVGPSSRSQSKVSDAMEESGKRGDMYNLTIGAYMNYARILELGNPPRMQHRPFIRPAINRIMPKFGAEIRAEYAKIQAKTEPKRRQISKDFGRDLTEAARATLSKSLAAGDVKVPLHPSLVWGGLPGESNPNILSTLRKLWYLEQMVTRMD